MRKTIFDWTYGTIRCIGKQISNLLRIAFYSIRFIGMISAIILFSSSAYAQKAITLQMCHQQSDSLFPLVAQKINLLEIGSLETQNIQAEYLPKLDLNAKLTYQSKVTEISLPSAAMGGESPSVPKTQYGATLDIKQIIYDGGIIKQAKAVNSLKTETEKQKVEIDLYKLKEQINKLFFFCLLLQENKNIIDLAHQNITESRKVLESSVMNGMVNASELDNLDAELLKLEQQNIELVSKKEQVIQALSYLSCMDISSADSLILPEISTAIIDTICRLEHMLFDQQTELLDANIKLTANQRRPKFMAFGTAGIGYPGLNMFSGALEPYYLVGGQISWNIWDWKQTNRKKEVLTLQKQIITHNRDAFDINLNTQISEASHANSKLTQLIEKDKEIIGLRERISKRSASQLENGSITSAAYLIELNAEKQARLDLKAHEIQLTQAKVDELSLAGRDLFTK